jgi:hypothetical protein
MPPPKYKTFEVQKGGIVIRDNDGKRGRSRDAGGKAIHHDGKPAETADPSEGNDLAMTMARTAAATKISIAPLATTMTKGKVPAAMMTIHLHEEQREVVIAAEINRRMARVKGDVILRHPHQAAPMAAAVAVVDQ